MPIKGRGGMNVGKRSRASNIIPELAEDSMYGYVSIQYLLYLALLMSVFTFLLSAFSTLM